MTKSIDIVDIERVLDFLGEGKSLSKACKEACVSYSSMHNTLMSEEYRNEYRTTRELGLFKQLDEMEDLLDIEVDNYDRVKLDKIRLKIETRKWKLSKLLPRLCGDKVDINHGGQSDNPIVQRIERVVIDNVRTLQSAKVEDDVVSFL